MQGGAPQIPAWCVCAATGAGRFRVTTVSSAFSDRTSYPLSILDVSRCYCCCCSLRAAVPVFRYCWPLQTSVRLPAGLLLQLLLPQVKTWA